VLTGTAEVASEGLNMIATLISRAFSMRSGTMLIAALASAIDALTAAAGSERLHVQLSDVTRPPAGWVEFCARQTNECAGARATPRHIALSPEAWKELVRVNKWVNETIKPLTDLDHWGWLTTGPILMMATGTARTTSCSSGAS
jgi:predicted transglutaminase-like cysteine proteinase